jgi:hypothetical protein
MRFVRRSIYPLVTNSLPTYLFTAVTIGLLTHQATPYRLQGGLRTAANVQFLVDGLDVARNRIRGERQLPGDPLAGGALGNQCQHLDLPGCQMLLL